MLLKERILAIALSLVLVGATVPAPVRAQNMNQGNTKHVLLISIDGMHAVDYENCVASKTCPTLAALGKTGVHYTRTTTSRPSDSFPGLMALVTGGSPRTVGAFYDVAYDRVLAPPLRTTGNGLPGTADDASLAPCLPNQIYTNSDGSTGTQTEYEEGDEFDETQLNGRPAPAKNALDLIDGNVTSINPDRLIRDPFNNSPEVNSLQIVLPGLMTATGFNCGALVPNGDDWTTDFNSIKCYDQLKVNAIVNEINGKNHLATRNAPVPAILGMNFQAVSVGQKLIEKINGVRVFGGYTNAAGDPTPSMLGEIQFVDAAIGQMVAALKHQGLLDSTAIIITAKHGQSPIDTNRFFPNPGHSGTNGEPPSAVLLPPNPNLLPAVYSDPNNGLGIAEDDISQIWLTDSSQTQNAVTALENAGTAIGLGQLYYGASLTTLFNPPGLPNVPGPCCQLRAGGDPRTPDIVVIPNVGVVYTGSLKKQSEHGGFAWDDTNVMLLVSNPSMQARTVNSFVETAQVAPTILQLLGLNPNALDAVRIEGTPVLPSLFGGGNQNQQ